MADHNAEAGPKVALITGAARRIGAETARTLHAAGLNVVLHYRGSAGEAEALAASLNVARPDSATLVQGDLLETARLPALIEKSAVAWGRLDVLVNNASSFYPTPIIEATEEQWADLLGSNLKAPFFLSKAAAPNLAKTTGIIVNMVDIHGDQPLKGYPIYSIAKAGLVMLTKSLARELAPKVRVNAVAPGAILWPEDMGDAMQQEILTRIPLARPGEPADIARAIRFLVQEAHYMTGQVLTVDGGRSLGY